MGGGKQGVRDGALGAPQQGLSRKESGQVHLRGAWEDAGLGSQLFQSATPWGSLLSPWKQTVLVETCVRGSQTSSAWI